MSIDCERKWRGVPISNCHIKLEYASPDQFSNEWNRISLHEVYPCWFWDQNILPICSLSTSGRLPGEAQWWWATLALVRAVFWATHKDGCLAPGWHWSCHTWIPSHILQATPNYDHGPFFLHPWRHPDYPSCLTFVWCSKLPTWMWVSGFCQWVHA